jgi:hypothetical protein
MGRITLFNEERAMSDAPSLAARGPAGGRASG